MYPKISSRLLCGIRKCNAQLPRICCGLERQSKIPNYYFDLGFLFFNSRRHFTECFCYVKVLPTNKTIKDWVDAIDNDECRNQFTV